MKDLAFVQDAFKQSIFNTISIPMAAEAMYQAKMRSMSSLDWDKVLTYVNNLRFPLTIYRGFKYVNRDDIKLGPKEIGVSWTVDKELFNDPNSHFVNCNYITVGEITEEQIDWVSTIQNYIYYSLPDIHNRFPEREITLKSNTLPHNITVVSKETLFE